MTRARRWLLLLLVAVSATLLVACGAILGLDPLTEYVEPTDAGEDGAADSGSVLDAAEDADAQPNDDDAGPNEAGVAPCDATEQPPAMTIYVSAKSVAGERNGTVNAPYASIAQAVDAARTALAPMIAVDEGVYKEEVSLINVAANLTLDGAWIYDGVSWDRDCATDRKTKTTIRSTSDTGLRVANNPSNMVVTLSNLTIESGPEPTTPDDSPTADSRYGLFVDGSPVRLIGVKIIAHAGGKGGKAADGADGTSSCTTATGDACPTAPSNGANGADAAAASPGTFGPSGFQPGDGKSGKDGKTGSNGTPGSVGVSRDDCWSSCQAQPRCENTNAATKKTGGRGPCGCGGTGGGPGSGGRGGGASIGIYAVGVASVDVSYTEIVAQNGGAGSPGGKGGKGGAPTAGVAGTPVDCWESKCCRSGTCPDCGCYGPPTWNDAVCQGTKPTNRPLAGGSAGGTGRPGGKGSDGSGGAGGPSFAIVQASSATLRIVESSRVWGSGGQGAGISPDGAFGERQIIP